MRHQERQKLIPKEEFIRQGQQIDVIPNYVKIPEAGCAENHAYWFWLTKLFCQSDQP